MEIVCQKTATASASTPAAMMISPMAGRRSPMARPPPPNPPVMSRQSELFEDAFEPRGLDVEESLVVVAEQRDLRPVAGLAGFCPLWRRRHLLHQRDHGLALGIVDAG